MPMAQRILWDKYETALLIDTFWEIEKSPESRQILIKKLSEELRAKAVNAGMDIDDTFRNVNGITMQLSPIGHAFFPDRPSLTTSAMFNNMVQMYLNDRAAYDTILLEARAMVKGKKANDENVDRRQAFGKWLSTKQTKRSSESSLVDAMDTGSRYSLSHKMSHKSFWEMTLPEFEVASSAVLKKRWFRLLYLTTAQTLEKAVVLYKEFLVAEQNKESDSQPQPNTTETESSDQIEQHEETVTTTVDPIKEILKEHYSFGFRFESVRELMRFRQFAEAISVSIPEDDDQLKAMIIASGTVIDDKVYCTGDDLPQSLQRIIDGVFDTGISVAYYDCLLSEKETAFSQYNITSEEMLKEYLKKHVPGYAYSKKFMTRGKKRTEKEAVTDELIRVWGESPVESVDDLNARLPFIPLSNIWRVISGNDLFVLSSPGKYLFINRFLISPTEEENILEYVEQACSENGFASLSDMPLGDIEENNYELPQLAIINAIFKKVLAGKFHLNGRILTKDKPDLNAVSLLKDYLRGKDEVSFEEIADKAYELTGASNRQYAFQALFDEMVRVDANRFVATRHVNFDVDEIDHILSGFITDHFGAIRNVTTFAMFPVCGQAWNHYLLESYCYKYSKAYRLRVIQFNDKNSGIIVEQDYNQPYNEMLAIELVRSDVELTEAAAGSYLSNAGYMIKSKFAMLTGILQRANELKRDR